MVHLPQTSADNLRQSMQRYLATKHQHLKKASEQLLSNRPSEFRQSLGLLPPAYQPPPRPPSLHDEHHDLEIQSHLAKNLAENLAKSHEDLVTKDNENQVLHQPPNNSQGAVFDKH